MRLGIVTNVVEPQEKSRTTYRVAAEAINRGHEVWLMVPANFSYEPDDTVHALARSVPHGRYASPEQFIRALNDEEAPEEWITLDELDVVLLRNNPPVQKPWAKAAGIHFSRIAMSHGVIVLNDPNGLSKATNKLYLQTFPEEVRPRTLITRSTARIGEFAQEHGTNILKPLQGYGGRGVFIVRADDLSQLKDIVLAVSRDGYVIAQEYLSAAAAGDTRLFLMNGEPLRYKGKYAAFRRVRTGDDVRSNVHAGGRLRKAKVDDTMLRLAEMVRPRLVEDGMFLVGLDIAGDKLLEINVFTPGGFGSAEMFEKVDFGRAVIDALERKVQYMKFYRRKLSNVELATL